MKNSKAGVVSGAATIKKKKTCLQKLKKLNFCEETLKISP